MKDPNKIIKSAIWHIVVLMLCSLTLNCYSGVAGNLHPQKGEGYSILETSNDRRAAQIIFGETTVQIEGSWTQSIMNYDFTIENNSDILFSIDLKQAKIEIEGEAVATRIDSIWKTESSSSEKAKQIYKDYWNYEEGKAKQIGEMRLECPSKQKCSYLVNVVFPETKLNKSKAVRITLPSLANGNKKTEIIFNCSNKSVLDSLTTQLNQDRYRSEISIKIL